MSAPPIELVREVCAGRLAEAAWTGDAAERELLLRVSYYLSPSPEETRWPAPSAEDLKVAAKKLRALSHEIATAGFFTAPALIARRTFAARHARALMADVLLAGAELLERP